MTAIIILAAGASTRMNGPKQLLPYKEKSLVQQAIDTALATNSEQVILVLGANAERIREQTNTAGVEVVVNGSWKEGMASSVRLGISTLQQEFPDVDSATIMLCDQPFVTADLLQKLAITQEQSGKKITASYYKQTAGVPVVFDKTLFPKLLKLEGQEGAKKLLSIYSDDVATVPFAEGEMDIDTEEDYQRLLHHKGM
jgi:molybdenum cofactor cytidylyltransferase